MLRRSLIRALERKAVNRPVMAKARGVPGRARHGPPAATVVTAGEPIYTGEELDLPPHVLREERAPAATGRRQQQSPMIATRGGGRIESTPRARSRLPTPAAVRARDDEREDEAEEELDGEGSREEDDDAPVSAAVAAGRGRGLDGDEVDGDEGEEEEEEEEDADVGGDDGTEKTGGGGGVSGAPGSAQKSKEAYRFLLDHIDAEIAALQRRHTAVTTRRQTLEERNAHRIKELFEFMESPWMLLESEASPPFPATGVDVYLKEQQGKKGSGHSGGNAPAAAAGASHGDGHGDKMFVLACHKNYRSLPLAEKRFYEEAANYNAAVRQELKYRLATGCARFEAFCQQVKECTADMARAGQVPELPATWRSHGGGGSNGASYQGLSKWQRTARQAQATAAAHEATTAAAAVAEERKGPATAGLGKRARAHRKVKDAAAAAAKKKGKRASEGDTGEEEEEPAEVEEDVEEVELKAFAAQGGKNGGRKRAAAVKAAAAKPVPKPAKAKAGGAKAASVSPAQRKDNTKSKPGAGNRNKGKGRGKASVPATSSSTAASASRSASIPLPDMSKLATKKIKKAAAAVAGKKAIKKTVKPSSPAPKKSGGKGKRRK